jgi:transcriptional regulator with XRE-family HTH domain
MAQTQSSSETERRKDLAQFLRGRRERLSPASAGLTVGSRRRAKGLLREEVAQMAGVGLTWYTWLEQARAITPSVHVIDSLARALRLDAAERAHLFRLARPELEPVPATQLAKALSDPLRRALIGLEPHPAYAINMMWDVIGWNDSATRLFGDFGKLPAEDRNIIHLLFCDPAWEKLFVDCQTIRESSVAQFRASTARLGADPGFISFVEAMGRANPEFQSLWRRQDVREPYARRKDLAHPQAGRLSFDYVTLRPDGEDDVRFTIYMPADARTGKKLEELLKKRATRR